MKQLTPLVIAPLLVLCTVALQSFKERARPAAEQTTGWQEIFGMTAVRDVAVDGAGNVLVTTTRGKVYHKPAASTVWKECSYYTGTTGAALGDSQYPVSIASNGTNAICTDVVGHVRRDVYPPSTTSPWSNCGSFNAKDVAITKAGTRWMINAQGRIYRAVDCSNWEQMTGSDARRISAAGTAGNERVWMANSAGKVYRWGTTGWTQMGGSSVADVAVADDGTVWCTNTSGYIYKWHGLGWTKLSGSDASRIAAGAGSVWMVNTVGKLYRLYY